MTIADLKANNVKVAKGSATKIICAATQAHLNMTMEFYHKKDKMSLNQVTVLNKVLPFTYSEIEYYECDKSKGIIIFRHTKSVLFYR